MRTRVLIPSGVLGLGFSRDALAHGVAAKPDIICIDGGSTDSGPYYLGTGTSKYARATCKAEWRQLMVARAALGVPLVIGSCGTCGSDTMVDWMMDITRELALELGQRVKVARLYSDQPIKRVRAAELRALGDVNPTLRGNIVALAGAEQMQAALETGADIVLAGRMTDTAVISTLPLMRGAHKGAAWHGAKIGECGALCSTNPTSGVVIIDFDETGFTVEPMEESARCTPHTVSAHMLYENADPFILHEPGGHLDVTQARYAAQGRRVRVEGSRWVPSADYTVKLEGAAKVGCQTTVLALLRDPRYVARAHEWASKLQDFLNTEITAHFPESFTLEFRLIGLDATLGALETGTATPNEVGVLGIITADTQETASEIAKFINPHLLHFPLTKNEELPTFAFPYSPAQTDRGPLYEFTLNHTMPLTHPMDAFRLETEVLA
ncbi:MAG: acyclic terpene utilization AtuA family protein [Rhodobacteraceae bacterium]|nr:acyclic terpene utilization AtuA family protein [Paracoccaceae bacterium]